MHRLFRGVLTALAVTSCFPPCATAQNAFTWQQIRERFEAANPTLIAGKIGIEETRAMETSAYLRPNPDLTFSIDQIDPFTTHPYRPFGAVLPVVSFDYLHERQQLACVDPEWRHFQNHWQRFWERHHCWCSETRWRHDYKR